MTVDSLASDRFGSNSESVIFKLVIQKSSSGTRCEISLGWISRNFTGSTLLVQVMAWCPQATSYYLGQYWPRSLASYAVTKLQWLKLCLFTHFSKYIYSVSYPMAKLFHCNSGYDHNDDVIKWKLFPRYWPFVRGIHQSPVNSPHKGQWRGTLMFSLICTWTNGWVNNRHADDLRCHRTHYDVTVMIWSLQIFTSWNNKTAIVACVKFCRDHIIAIRISSKHFPSPLITGENRWWHNYMPMIIMSLP